MTKEKPLSYLHTVPFGHLNVVVLFWDAEKCHFVLSSVGEDAPSQQFSDCCSTSTSPEEYSGFGVLFSRKSCFWMGAGPVLAGEQQGTWQGGAEEEVLAARLRKESAVCDCCEAQSQNSAPQQGHQDKGQEGKVAFPNSSQNPRNASAMLLGAACLLTQGEHFKHFFISWLCSQAIFLLSSLCCSSLSSSPGTGHLPLVDVFPRSLMHQPFSV